MIRAKEARTGCRVGVTHRQRNGGDRIPGSHASLVATLQALIVRVLIHLAFNPLIAGPARDTADDGTDSRALARIAGDGPEQGPAGRPTCPATQQS